MGIRRSELSFDDKFTQIPNEWARDARLSRRARGLLVEIMSHRVGWHVSIRSLAKAGKEGRDAIQSALNELLEHGYVQRMQGRAQAGKFAEIEYELCDPPAVSGNSVHGAVSGFAVSGSTVSGESDHKEEHLEEEHQEEDHQDLLLLIAPTDDGPSFDDFWAVWPRKDSKKTAQTAWARAIKKADPAAIVAAARAYAGSPHRPEKQFVPYGASWLNAERWNDPLPSPRAGSQMSGNDRVRAAMDAGARVQAALDQQGMIA